MIALDASALVALLFSEPGHEVVAELADEGCVSAVNLAEVLERLGREGRDLETVRNEVLALGIEVVPFDTHDAVLAAALAPLGRSVGLSLGDRSCVALGMSRGIRVVTADRVWAMVDLGVEVQLIR